MKARQLNIVAFDMPFPPNYGGAIDIFFKIKCLHQMGIKIHLHCFLYAGKEPEDELKKYCEEVFYYERRRFRNPFIGDVPYIVSTRDNDELLINLTKNNYPILFEGLHSTYFLNHPKLKNRIKIVRAHNVEHHYYHALEKEESNFFKKYFFRVEADRLENYERILNYASAIVAISPLEYNYFQNKFKHAYYISAFHNNEQVNIQPGRGNFILYHGNLAVGENNAAALYLVKNVFARLRIPCVIAGNNPSRPLQNAIREHNHISLRDKISNTEILELVKEAHANVLVTSQTTGIKLKLLNALYLGRHCIVNHEMVDNTGLESICRLGSGPKELMKTIQELWEKDFTEKDIEMRKSILEKGVFDNEENARQLIQLIFGEK